MLSPSVIMLSVAIKSYAECLYVGCRYAECRGAHKTRIHNTLFSSFLMNRPNNLECLSLASLSGIVQYTTLAYWAHA